MRAASVSQDMSSAKHSLGGYIAISLHFQENTNSCLVPNIQFVHDIRCSQTNVRGTQARFIRVLSGYDSCTVSYILLLSKSIGIEENASW